MPVERIHKPIVGSENNGIVTVTGISSSGKDYLVNLAAKKEPSLIGGRVRLFHFGSELTQVVAQNMPHTLSNGRDSLKNLPPALLTEYVEETLRKLLGVQPVVQLTHVVVNQQGKLMVNPKSENTTLAKAYLYVWSDPALIYSWRLAELAKRNRTIESIDDISFHQEIALATTTILSRKLGAGMFVVYNICDDVNENVDQINNIIEELLV
ncbi:MAG: hypothetical protein COY80_04575 [Candidatus Pacebacteria bacterium CG_4_10_14_0_8_um_filter_42_14]|nr:MAG: hypothetical protein COY80_04575 [Candidatus Pacebacteria bacterium CG_4_10_14_0_8_um_filter_42_14]